MRSSHRAPPAPRVFCIRTAPATPSHSPRLKGSRLHTYTAVDALTLAAVHPAAAGRIYNVGERDKRAAGSGQ